jgi:sulfatase modifying factor 1
MKLRVTLFIGIIIGILSVVAALVIERKTSTNEYCASCHVHPQATESWNLSTHHSNSSGVSVSCIECHLPPKGDGHYTSKIKMGAKDIWGKLTKDSADFNWEAKSTIEFASKHVHKSACVKCHQTMFPTTLSQKGEDAHLYYDQNQEKLRCISCHLSVGHYNPNSKGGLFSLTSNDENLVKYKHPEQVDTFEDFVETIPTSSVSFQMVAIPGGSFNMGSDDKESLRDRDEGPVSDIDISPFFMSEIEVSWDEYLEFYAQTGAEGRSTDTEGLRTTSGNEVDGVTGATPPYGQPDQGWGVGNRPAITMSFHAAETYCRWLSQVTGKTYRLPTEAEWEYAARGGSESPYFFEGNPKRIGKKGLFLKDNSEINSYVIFSANSKGKTGVATELKANPFGLKNMLGNVAEYCSDWYAEDYYSQRETSKNPIGPSIGKEHVIRGGSYKSDAKDIRSAARDFTRTEAWLVTDPQMPKSIWWLSDCTWVGIRVVCEYDANTGNR